MTLTPSDDSLQALARKAGMVLHARGQWLATAESCTGGLVAKLMTDIAGSSGWFERGLVTYSNAAKRDLLGVPAATLETAGAVSAETVVAMADGLLARAPVQWTLAISGIAGPGGGGDGKPVGTTWIAWAGSGIAASASRFRFDGGRDEVRRLAAEAALNGLIELLAASDSKS